ncbi:MAG: hypothetical protein WBV94_27110 [Blastocatellia bacterium]
MGRFARSQEVALSTSPSRPTARPDFSSGPERAKSQKLRKRAKGMRYLWIVTVSMIGLSSGWMLGQSSIGPRQEDAAIEPTVSASSVSANDSIENKKTSEEFAVPSAASDEDAQSVEPQADYSRKPVRSHRFTPRGPRARAQNGAVTMMLKPFKAINPLKLRKLRPW